MIKRILAPLDGTPAAEVGLSWAQRTAAACGAEVHLLTVVEDSNGQRNEQMKAARGYLKGHQKRMASVGLSVSADVKAGSAAEVILESAADADLTVMTYGSSRWLFGRALDLVLQRMTRPVVVVRASSAPSCSLREVRRILVPIDTAPHSKEVLPAAAGLAEALNASLTLCHVVAPTGAYVDSGRAPPVGELVADPMADRARYFLDGMAMEAHRLGVSVEVAVATGQAFSEISRLADRTGAGVIAMATRGSDRLSRVLGSVAHSVTQGCRVPCLLVRPPGSN